MTEYVQIITTAGTRNDAEMIARVLVDRRLAACVQLFGPIFSTYRWQGSIETNQEWQCAIKTRRDLFAQVEATIRKLHPYDVPEILALPILSASQNYLEWIDTEVIRPQ
jgi:periplasmic divalent cation tolerance protein